MTQCISANEPRRLCQPADTEVITETEEDIDSID